MHETSAQGDYTHSIHLTLQLHQPSSVPPGAVAFAFSFGLLKCFLCKLARDTKQTH